MLRNRGRLCCGIVADSQVVGLGATVGLTTTLLVGLYSQVRGLWASLRTALAAHSLRLKASNAFPRTCSFLHSMPLPPHMPHCTAKPLRPVGPPAVTPRSLPHDTPQARIYLAIGRDGLLPAEVGRVDAESGAPVAAQILAGAVAVPLAVSARPDLRLDSNSALLELLISFAACPANPATLNPTRAPHWVFFRLP